MTYFPLLLPLSSLCFAPIHSKASPDIIDLAQTVVMFRRLAKIEIRETKGKTLGNSVLQVHREFEPAVAAYCEVAYDIIDVKSKQFGDVPPISNCFKLYDLFPGLLGHPVSRDELEKKHVALIQA